MDTVPLSDIFNIVYGSQLDLDKQEIDLENGVNFVSRCSKSLGVQTKIKLMPNNPPFTRSCITVALGGSILSAYVQQHDFYTAQNIKVLKPKINLTDLEKKFYCYAIKFNGFRYSSHSREANKTLNNMLVPSINSIPNWVSDNTKTPRKQPLHNKEYVLVTSNWRYFLYKELFTIEKGKTPSEYEDNGNINLVSSSSINNGILRKIHSTEKYNPENLITIASNGSIGSAFFQEKIFFATGDVNILVPKFKINPYIAIFLNTVICKERFKFNYGRKWGKEKMIKHKIKLPVDSQGEPDWQFMENYIKSLPYSSNL